MLAQKIMHLKTLLTIVLKSKFALIFLFGGTGNQLYKYVLSKYLAKNNYNVFLITLKTPRRDTKRETIFTKVNFKNSKVKLLEFPKVSQIIVSKFIYILDSFFNHNKFLFLMTDNLPLETHIKNLKKIIPKIIIAYGYFHEAKFYKENILLLKELLSYDSYKKQYNDYFYENTLAIHYRIGDYASNKYSRKNNGLLSPEYFGEAINYLIHKSERRINSIDIFSDSPTIAKKYLELYKFDLPLRIVNTNNFDDIERILEMSFYRNIIISNSTFSWWSALISSEFKNSFIIMPDKFYKANNYASYNYKIPKSNIHLIKSIFFY